MKFFEKKTEKPVRDDVIDEAYIDRLLSGDRKPAKPAKKPLPIRKPLILFGGVGLVLVFALITMIVAVSVGRRTDPNFGFKDLFAPTTAAATQPTTTVPATLSTSPAVTLPAVRPTEPTETEPAEKLLHILKFQDGDIIYQVPNETLGLSLWQYYCTSPTLPIPDENAPEEEWIQLFYSLLAEEDSWYHQALTSEYATPQEINLEYLLSRGIAQGGSPLESYPEAQWLLEHSFVSGRDVIRLPWSDIMSLESVYFGTNYDEHATLWYPYNRENATFYYYYEGDDHIVDVLGIVDYRWLEDGNVCVRYAAEGWDEPVLKEVVLRPKADYFQIVSNLPVPTEPSTVELADIPDMSGSVYEPGAMFAGEGYYGHALWDGGDFSIALPLLEPFCEGAKAINEEIRNIYQPIIDEVKQDILYQSSSRYWKVSYTTYVGDDVLSIVISQYTMSDSVFYQVFNLDLATGEALDSFEMIRRYTGLTYPEFLLRANYTVVNHLQREYPMESEDVTSWLEKLETDIWVMNDHKLILNEEGTLILLNGMVRSMAAGYLNVQIPFDPNACGEEFTDWELESYRWLFGIQTDGAYTTTKGSVLEKAFFFDPERFLRYLSGSEYWLEEVSHLLAFELNPDHVPQLRMLCQQYLSRSDTAKAAQAILDRIEKYVDNY